MYSPTSLIIFGATGDLMAKKIAPALFYLFENGKLPQNFHVIGASRRELTDEAFGEMIEEIILKHRHDDVDRRVFDRFLDLFTFSQVRFENDEDYEKLKATLDTRDRSYGKTNRIIYLAVPPKAFPSIFEHRGFQKIVTETATGGFLARVIVEKPFGTDSASAEALEKILATCFSEEQIYRVDHYLAKDILQNIIDFRFKNNLFEHIWNKDSIESIHIRLWETLGVDTRGSFFDQLGALRDVGQNHLLEMLALITMERPAVFTPEELCAKRTEVLQQLQAPAEREMTTATFRAQHEGYRSVVGVEPDSTTETYFAIRTSLETPRWSGVPIYLESGKRMHETRKEIVVKFRAPYENTITVRIAPLEEMVIEFLAKRPGILESGLQKRNLHFKFHKVESNTQYVAEYGKMIQDAIDGDRTLFVGADEVRATWRFTDKIMDAWKKNIVPMAGYMPDTDEAVMASHLIKTPPLNDIVSRS